MAMNLGPGETVVFEGHPSWRAILGFYIKGILIVGVIAALVGLYGETIGDGTSTTAIVAVLLIGSAIVVLVGFLKRVSTNYMITTRRLHIKHGIISRDVQETKIERVQDVNYSQSFYQRVMQIGDVDFDTAAQDPQGDFIFAGVANPEEVVDRVHHSTEPGGAGARPESSPSGSGLGDERTDLPR
jgi:uncharacterized membrane protein YdbT with pleckstrin-like domain